MYYIYIRSCARFFQRSWIYSLIARVRLELEFWSICSESAEYMIAVRANRIHYNDAVALFLEAEKRLRTQLIECSENENDNEKDQIRLYIKNCTIQHDLIHASLSDIHLPTMAVRFWR